MEQTLKFKARKGFNKCVLSYYTYCHSKLAYLRTLHDILTPTVLSEAPSWAPLFVTVIQHLHWRHAPFRLVNFGQKLSDPPTLRNVTSLFVLLVLSKLYDDAWLVSIDFREQMQKNYNLGTAETQCNLGGRKKASFINSYTLGYNSNNDCRGKCSAWHNNNYYYWYTDQCNGNIKHWFLKPFEALLFCCFATAALLLLLEQEELLSKLRLFETFVECINSFPCLLHDKPSSYSSSSSSC